MKACPPKRILQQPRSSVLATLASAAALRPERPIMIAVHEVILNVTEVGHPLITTMLKRSQHAPNQALHWQSVLLRVMRTEHPPVHEVMITSAMSMIPGTQRRDAPPAPPAHPLRK